MSTAFHKLFNKLHLTECFTSCFLCFRDCNCFLKKYNNNNNNNNNSTNNNSNSNNETTNSNISVNNNDFVRSPIFVDNDKWYDFNNFCPICLQPTTDVVQCL